MKFLKKFFRRDSIELISSPDDKISIENDLITKEEPRSIIEAAEPALLVGKYADINKEFNGVKTDLTTKHEPYSNEPHSNVGDAKRALLAEKYPGVDDFDLYFLLKTKEYDEELTTEECEFLDNHDFEDLGRILYREHMEARSLAILELMGNTNAAPPDVYEGNFAKEPIDFTLKYFEKYICDKPNDAERLVINAFPIMHPYIKRRIYNQQNIINVENRFDLQKAYDEFLLFCKNVFSIFTDKKIRDEQVKQHFRTMRNGIIQIIEQN